MASSCTATRRLERRPTIVVALSMLLVAGVEIGDARASGPERISNTTPYRVSKPSAAKGRSGTVTLTTRALLGKSGETDVELTTGELDAAGAAPGTLTNVQIATTNADGQRQTVKEYADPPATGGYVSFSYMGLPRGQFLNVKANVTGTDLARTDVVSANPRVRLRPDLVVEHVEAPPKAVPGVPVTITSVISERNQDVGARAACTLWVDGVEVDRADGIWVDAGGTVSCAFTQTFQTSGVKSIAVQATDVIPADYDVSNNAASTSLLVRDLEPFDYFSLDGWSIEHAFDGHVQSWSARSDNGTVYGRDYDDVESRREIQQYVGYYAEIHKPVDFPLTRLLVTESMDGAVLRSFTLDEIGPAACVLSSAGTDQIVWFQICSSRRPDGSGTAMLRYQSGAGEVTYFSRGYDTSWHQSPDGTVTTDSSYSWNRSDTLRTNVAVPWGASYTVDVTLIAGDTIYRGPVTMMLQRQTIVDSRPWRCNESTGDFGWSRYCEGYTDSRAFVSGNGYGPLP